MGNNTDEASKILAMITLRIVMVGIGWIGSALATNCRTDHIFCCDGLDPARSTTHGGIPSGASGIEEEPKPLKFWLLLLLL
jgi:hypothetical protein